MEVRQKARSNTAGNNAYTGPAGQLTVDTDTWEIRSHDGVTAGGHRILSLSQLQALFVAIADGVAGVSGLQAALDAKYDKTGGPLSGGVTIQETAGGSTFLKLQADPGDSNVHIQYLGAGGNTIGFIYVDQVTDSLNLRAYGTPTWKQVQISGNDGRMTINTGESYIHSGDQGTAGGFRANNEPGDYLTGDKVWLAATEVALVDGATITPNFSTGFNFNVTLGGNRTLANPTNVKVGQSGAIRITQDATGGRTLAFGSAYKFATGANKVIAAGANDESILTYLALSSTKIVCNLLPGIA